MEFDEAISYLAGKIINILSYIPASVKENTYEIRLRENKPLVLTGKYGIYFVGNDSSVTSIDSRNSYIVTHDDIIESVSGICGYSVYSHQNDIADGFVTFGTGHRAGFCGTAVTKNGVITTVRDISSLNIRISRKITGAADELLKAVYSEEIPSVIVCGAPCTGKTTVLKDAAFRLSSDYKYGFLKTVIIDERFEMSDSNGINCDILRGYPKDIGIVHSMRVLSPDLIVCDEVATTNEAEKIIKGMNSGIKFLVSVHGETMADFKRRQISQLLLNSGEFKYVVFLDSNRTPGQIGGIYKTEDLK